MDATDNELLEAQYYGCCVVDLYNGHRPHRALALTPPHSIRPVPAVVFDELKVHRRDRLGGVVREYVSAA